MFREWFQSWVSPRGRAKAIVGQRIKRGSEFARYGSQGALIRLPLSLRRTAHCQRLSAALYKRQRLRKPIFTMAARIYIPSKTAMQSGLANTKAWVVEFEPEEPRTVEPLMGWTSSGDMRQQLRLRFASKEEAVAYCERQGIAYLVSETTAAARRGMSYSDNFSFKRRDAWTH